jgi:hypothetical protein
MRFKEKILVYIGNLMGGIFFYPKPKWCLTQEMELEFEQIYQAALGPDSPVIEYVSNYPKWQFLQYLVNQHHVALHGSNNPGISTLEPKEQTDFSGKRVKAVFATRDSIWSIFFAILDMSQYQGSLRNACWVIGDGTRGENRYYFFSINRSPMEDVWTDGMVYILPGEEFAAASRGVVRFDEWLCNSSMDPIARLPIAARDFPFKSRVAVHKEGESMLISWLRYKGRTRRPVGNE